METMNSDVPSQAQFARAEYEDGGLKATLRCDDEVVGCALVPRYGAINFSIVSGI
jgi:hypothetical protein